MTNFNRAMKKSDVIDWHTLMEYLTVRAIIGVSKSSLAKVEDILSDEFEFQRLLSRVGDAHNYFEDEIKLTTILNDLAYYVKRSQFIVIRESSFLF